MRKKIPILALAFVGFVWNTLFAQMYISEVNFAPSGDDIPLEFIEIRGPSSSTIADNTYILFVEGDQESSEGQAKSMFDVSGLSFGSNGYLVFVMDAHPYTTNSSATVRVADDLVLGEEGWEGEPLYTGEEDSSKEQEWESASVSILLVTADEELTELPDIDTDDDGAIDDSFDTWTIHDGISLLDDDGTEIAYASVVFKRNDLDDMIAPSDAYTYATSFNPAYAARIGESTGSTGNDWVAVGSSGSGTNGLSATSRSDDAFDNIDITDVGGASFELTEITYSGGAFVPGDVADDEDLVIASSLTTSEDFECHDLTINSGQTLTIEDAGSFKVYGALINNGTMVVESGGTLWTFSSKEHDGATFERNTTYADGRYSFVGSPVEGDADNTGSDLGPISYYFDETENYDSDDGLSQWKDASSVELVPGVGYAQAGQEQISFTGVPNDGTIEVAVTHTVATSSTSGNRGFNLLSNPYPASINGSDFFTENTSIDGSIYIWDDGGSDDGVRQTSGDYIIANSAGYVSGGSDRQLSGGTARYEGDIRSFQGFFVRLSDDSGADNSATVSFTEDMRNGGDNNDGRFFRIADESVNVKLSLASGAGHYDEVLVAFIDDATIGKDRMYDAMKLTADRSFQVYSTIEEAKYAIQGLPKEENAITDLAFDIEESLNLTLTVASIQGLSPQRTILLTDKLTGEIYDLSTTTEVNFSSEEGTYQNRFTLAYTGPDVLSAAENLLQPTYRFNGDKLTANFGQQVAIEGFAIYDISGKVLLENSEARTANELVIEYEWSGLKILKITSKELVITQKFRFD